MKKLLALLTALLIALSCLSGCGGADSKKKKPSADKNDITITVWSGDGGAQAVWEELVDDWNDTEGREKNIFIKWETVMDASQLDVAFQNDTLPDIIGVGSHIQSEKIRKAGKEIPLEDLPGGKEFLEEYDQPGIEGVTMFDGKQYGVRRKATTAGLVYNKDLFKKAGIVDENGEAKAPTTVAEVREYAKKIQALGGKVYGFAFPLKFGLGYTVNTLTQNSFDIKNPVSKTDLDAKTVSLVGYKDRYQWILDMKKDGTVFPAAEALDNDTARSYFASGIIGMIPAVSWDVGVYTTQFETKCDWDVCPFPVLDGREECSPYTAQGGSMSISSTAVKDGYDSPRAKAAMEVYKFIYSLKTRATLFERGTDLSCKTDVLEVVDESKMDPRFLKFASFVDPYYKDYDEESYAVEGETWAVLFQKVWMGEISLDAAIKDYEKRSTDGLRKAIAKGEYDVAKQKATIAQKEADYAEKKAKLAEAAAK